MSEELLGRINIKLTALLSLEVDRYLRTTPGAGRPKERSIDELLSTSGLSAKEIAAVLGKTERAVHLILQGSKTKSAKGRRK